MTVQGPVKKQQPDGMSHRGGRGWNHDGLTMALPFSHRGAGRVRRGPILFETKGGREEVSGPAITSQSPAVNRQLRAVNGRFFWFIKHRLLPTAVR